MPKVYVLYSPPPKDEGEDDKWTCRNWTEYACLSTCTSIIFFLIIVLTLVWILATRTGFNWGAANVEEMGNVHSFLMILGFVVLEGISITLYRVCRCCRRVYLKTFHFILHLLVLICAIGGYLAADGYSNSKPNERRYTAHAWTALLTLALFLLQFLIGFVAFLILTCCNDATGECRAELVPLHAAFGIANYAVSIAAVLTGMQEKLFAEGEGKAPGVEDTEMIFVKIILGFILFLFLLIHYILRREELRFRAHLPHFQPPPE